MSLGTQDTDDIPELTPEDEHSACAVVAHQKNQWKWNIGAITPRVDLLVSIIVVLGVVSLFFLFPNYLHKERLLQVPSGAMTSNLEEGKKGVFTKTFTAELNRINPDLCFTVQAPSDLHVRVFYQKGRQNKKFLWNEKYEFDYSPLDHLALYSVRIPQLRGKYARIKIEMTTKDSSVPPQITIVPTKSLLIEQI